MLYSIIRQGCLSEQMGICLLLTHLTIVFAISQELIGQWGLLLEVEHQVLAAITDRLSMQI